MSTVQCPAPTVPIGVGFDTSRYGHHVTFLREDLQPACPPCEFPESRQGYDQLLQKFQQLQQRCATTHFHIRIDAAGQYATNLETFLRELPFTKTITVGEPARNQNYRKALFPKRKADPVESLCAARFALVEKPKATTTTPPPFYHLREIVQRLEGQGRQSTRLTNQLHNLLARVFPELGLVVADLQARWLLQLLAKYPTPQQLARARLASLTAIPFVTEDKAQKIQAVAATTVASFTGASAATLVQELVGQLRDSLAAEAKLNDLMTTAYQQLPQSNHLDSIPGIGTATAAMLTAKMVAIERFATPVHVVAYFGIFPEENASGIDKEGLAKPGRHMHMSRKGNDLVRKYLAHLGCLTRLKGSGAQRRGPCPIHAAKDARHRSFSVNLDKKVFQCFHPPCGAHGNLLDLWAAVHGLPLHQAARHLAETFHIELSSPNGTGKRNP